MGFINKAAAQFSQDFKDNMTLLASLAAWKALRKNTNHLTAELIGSQIIVIVSVPSGSMLSLSFEGQAQVFSCCCSELFLPTEEKAPSG